MNDTQKTTTFYRYLRPAEYNQERHEVLTSAKGGIGFKVTNFSLGKDGRYLITASAALCSNEVVFNKTVARRILDGRSDYTQLFHFYADDLTAEGIGRGFVNSFDADTLASSMVYLEHAAQRYADGIENIMKSRLRAYTLSQLSLETIEALDIKSLYGTNK